MAKLTIQDVAKVLTDKNGLPSRRANKFASEMFAIILERLQEGEQVKIKGLGTFKVVSVEARESVNVRTGERIVIEGHDKVTFTPDTLMKELVNKPFSQFETVVLNDGVVFDDEQSDEIEEQSDDEEDNLPLEKRPLVNYVTDDEPVADQETSELVEEERTEHTINDTPTIERPIVTEPEPEEPKVDAPVVEESPAVDETPIEETSTVDESPAVEETPVEEQPLTVDIYDDEEEENKHTWIKWLFAVLGVLALMAVSAYGGYLYALKQMEPILVQLQENEVKEDKKVEEQIVDTFKTVKDSVVVSKPMTASEPARQAEPVETVKPMEVGKPNVATKSDAVEKSPTEESADPYAAKDERVRLGAYRIVGTLNVITVQPGQTFYSICKGNLGPDMECYVEVYNNFPRRPQVKVGQKIKIPKLELKKKRKR